MSESENIEPRPRMFLIVTFFPFFRGVQQLLEGVGACWVLFAPELEKERQQLFKALPFSHGEFFALVVYQILFGLVLIVGAYLLLTRLSEGSRQMLKWTFTIDVFLFLGFLIYFSKIDFHPPDATQFYFEVIWNLFEILLILCLSHSSIVRLTQGHDIDNAEQES